MVIKDDKPLSVNLVCSEDFQAFVKEVLTKMTGANFSDENFVWSLCCH